MRKLITPIAACALVVSCAPFASAATVFNNADGANEFISTTGNWNNGLPTDANPGTIAIDAEFDSNLSHSGYNVLHTAGTIARGAGLAAFKLGSGTTWVVDGAGVGYNTRGVSVGVGSSFTLNQGTADLTNNSRDTSVSGAGASIEVNDGVLLVGRDMIVNTDGSFTVNGGTVTIADEFYTQGFSSSPLGFFFNGGSTTAKNFHVDKPATATFGGSTAGSLELTFGLDADANSDITLDWLGGSLMELTVAGTDQAFYEGLFTGGDLLFEGSGAGSFGDNFQVSGETLSLIPEPSSLALLGLGGLCVLRRRRA
jgi:hypothetical protein